VGVKHFPRQNFPPVVVGWWPDKNFACTRIVQRIRERIDRHPWWCLNQSIQHIKDKCDNVSFGRTNV
jgi:hypothetical protein